MKHYFNAYMRFRCPVCNYSNPDYVIDNTVNDLVSTFFLEHSIALVTFILTLSMTLFYAVVTFTRINGW